MRTSAVLFALVAVQQAAATVSAIEEHHPLEHQLRHYIGLFTTKLE